MPDEPPLERDKNVRKRIDVSDECPYGIKGALKAGDSEKNQRTMTNERRNRLLVENSRQNRGP